MEMEIKTQNLWIIKSSNKKRWRERGKSWVVKGVSVLWTVIVNTTPFNNHKRPKDKLLSCRECPACSAFLSRFPSLDKQTKGNDSTVPTTAVNHSLPHNRRRQMNWNVNLFSLRLKCKAYRMNFDSRILANFSRFSLKLRLFHVRMSRPIVIRFG